MAVEGADSKSPDDILHSTMLVVVDPDSQVRGYYNSTGADAMAKIRQDLKDWLKV